MNTALYEVKVMSQNRVLVGYGTAFKDVEDNRNTESGWSIVQRSGVQLCKKESQEKSKKWLSVMKSPMFFVAFPWLFMTESHFFWLFLTLFFTEGAESQWRYEEW